MTIDYAREITEAEGPITYSINAVGAHLAEAADGNFWGSGATLQEATRNLWLAVFGCPVCKEDVFGDVNGWFHTQDLSPMHQGVES